MKKLQVLLLIGIMLLTGGCWDRTDISDLGLIVATGADLVKEDGEDKVWMTLQMANPVAMVPGGGGGGAGAPRAFWTVSGMGRSVRTASIAVAERIPKRLFWGQNRVFIVGEEAARRNIIPFLDRPLRGRSTRRNTYLVVARGTAKKVLEVEMPTFRASGLALNNILELEGGTEAIMPVTLNDFAYRLGSKVTAPVAPVVSVVPQTSLTVEDIKVPGGPSPTIDISGIAVFNPEGRLLDFLNKEETLGLMLVLNKSKEREITVACPVKGPQEPVIMHLVRSNSRTVVHMDEKGIPSIEVKIRTICDLWEHFGSHPGMTGIPYVQSLEKRVNTHIEKEIKMVVSRAQELNTDIFGFGEEVRRQHRDEWLQLGNHWSEIFPGLEVTVSAETSLRHRGLTIEAPGARKEHLL